MINRWAVYYKCDHMEQFIAETGLPNMEARAWMRNNNLPYLPYEWFFNTPADEKAMVGRVVGRLINLSDKWPEKVTFEGVSDYLDLVNQGVY